MVLIQGEQKMSIKMRKIHRSKTVEQGRTGPVSSKTVITGLREARDILRTHAGEMFACGDTQEEEQAAQGYKDAALLIEDSIRRICANLELADACGSESIGLASLARHISSVALSKRQESSMGQRDALRLESIATKAGELAELLDAWMPTDSLRIYWRH